MTTRSRAPRTAVAANRRDLKSRARGLRLSVSVKNQFGRKGAPQRRSFEHWIRTALSSRRTGGIVVNVILFDAAAARELNRKYRRKDYPTNILSFPYKPAPHDKSGLLGDLVICPPIVAREAAEQGKLLRDHYAHLTIHGVLHLLGYDHQTTTDAERMESLERRLLAGLGIADPYA